MDSCGYSLPIRGGTVLVDETDLARLAGIPWRIYRAGRHTYARASMRREGGRGGWPYVMLHRYLFDLEPGDRRCVDHIDGNGLNNCRSNLRVCSLRENARNRGLTSGRAGYKGVHLQSGAHVARIGDPRISLGSFASAVEAALAYNAAATKLYGEFANLNRIENSDRLRELLRERDALRLRIEAINSDLRAWPCG